MPPDYSTAEYWATRFSSQPEPFEWLKKPDELLAFVKEVTQQPPLRQRRMLHIGSGSSKLSLALRTLVQKPCQIWNVDFAREAIELGKAMEINVANGGGGDGTETMQWAQADLLNIDDVTTLIADGIEESLYDMIIDKSTSDAIACGADVELDPFLFGVAQQADTQEFGAYLSMSKKFIVHPMWLLALHLALVARPGASWIALSYSKTRFPWYLAGFQPAQMTNQIMPEVFLPWKYWILERTENLTRQEEVPSSVTLNAATHRPVVEHWVYVMRRTSQPLKYRKQSL